MAATTTQTSTDALWRKLRDTGDAEARRELLARFIGLAHHAAREVAPRVRDAISLEELVSAGSVGLVQAMAGFDVERGLAFSTYAMRRIRGAILDELRARDPLSRTDRAHVRQLEQAIAQLEQKVGRAPSSGEVATHIGVSRETLFQWRERLAHSIPLDASSPEGRTVSDSIPGDGEQLLDHSVEHAERREFIERALNDLPSRERHVVSRSYLDERPLREIAAEMGVTESRVCQLRAQALAKLRRVSRLELVHE
ncbi:MAG TPA: sigma-70 family RNA polymerase sigma factor [Gemmatimonadales bacterium]|jgi:RNA polymerase sigma factor for flagellar operon FliA|nr:sigma-70 family RNA polymerase sigma factor [Gemmatimonadales bacterium]